MEERICERDKFKSGVKDGESEGGDSDEVNQEESEQDEDDGMEKASWRFYSLLLRARPSTWNSLPDTVFRESAQSLNVFRRHLKTHPFAKHWQDVLCALEIF